MALEMSGEYDLPQKREIVWKALNDPAMLEKCIPGCETLEKLSDTEFQATVKLSIGPVSARFKGKVKLEDIDAPNGYKIVGEGEGGVAGFAKGQASVALADEGEGCKLTYKAEAATGGKIAQLGQRLISGSAKKTADRFFENFVEALKEYR
ncbi:MAG: carbon monoxide dehydrogenase subunit G [Xanthobacteraceae bacterium]|nr:carbon monoxide dehydrogenase subunit G [Xanthobacteraceae bacterium]MBX3524507.1 carbon monoxide dehydrogenase subunit G [Xanthobacteraceae bacterium]MBX3533560.1 carbon monoxide dehydrogenase subunit G [Xanthobacteraceae bacterium]MBX3548345.1 carbon monoxide dehydrogenase subunit G [Xanthobacteraceae bacterium]MCW5675675.1 carbon monoxide dehydrogenase subunit G [Xanthobacteraceae bacterium]